MTKVNKISVMLIAAIAAASFLSCTKEENAATGNHAIGFRSNDVWTKAMVSDADGLKNGGFHVYAQGTFAGTNETYRFDRHVTFTDGGWNYENLEYWLPTCKYIFRAYYPADLTVSETGDAIQGFELESQYGNQSDVLMATEERSTAQIETAGTTVPLTFKHLLSNLNVTLKVKQDSRDKVDADGNPVDENNDGKPDQELVNVLDAKVKAVAFNGVAQKANYSGTNWVEHTGSMAVGDNLNPVVDVTAGGVSIFGEDGLLAIPETLAAGDVSLYILADITLPTGTTMQKEWTLNLDAITWDPNTKYNYVATLTADFNIEFEEPKVESWGQEQMSGTVIIR